jgi:uncharacterized RDD family membrane protein YckC
MKCPKCGYLGFEHVERCRNCGYDFSLAPALSLPELPIRNGDAEDENNFDDLAFVDAASPRVRQSSAAPAATSGESGFAGHPAPPSGELPLFGERLFDDVPLITKASAPRPPLSVRRATPREPRLRSQARAPMLDLAPDSKGGPALSPAARAYSSEWPAERPPRVEFEPAPIGVRGAAVAIDLLILAAIDVVVVYFTMQICGLTFEDFSVLPKGPLVAFLLLQNGGYLVAFTVGGQTLGKMAAGIRVVPARSEAPIDLGRSIIRTLVWVALAVPAGLGFLTVLVGREHRGLHDRCAGTRVVRAPA